MPKWPYLDKIYFSNPSISTHGLSILQNVHKFWLQLNEEYYTHNAAMTNFRVFSIIENALWTDRSHILTRFLYAFSNKASKWTSLKNLFKNNAQVLISINKAPTSCQESVGFIRSKCSFTTYIKGSTEYLNRQA